MYKSYTMELAGLTPDVEVDLDEELKTKAVVEKSEDNQLQAAIEALD